MGFNEKEARFCLRHTKNATAAMVVYIARNGCNGFRCKQCPLGIVCNHKPINSKDYAYAVLQEINRRYSFWGRIKTFIKRMFKRQRRKDYE